MPRCCCSGGGGATALQALDTPSIDTTVTGLGTAGSPYVVSGDAVLVPDNAGTLAGLGANLLKVALDGLYVSCEDVLACGIGPSGGDFVFTTDTDVTPGGVPWSWVTNTVPLPDDQNKGPTAHAVVAAIAAGGGGGGDVSSTSTTVAPAGNYWDFVSNGPLADDPDILPTEHSVFTAIGAIPEIVTNDMVMFPVTTAGGFTMIDLSNAAGTGNYADNVFSLLKATDANEVARFSLALFAGLNADRTFQLPDIGAGATDTLVVLNSAQTLVGKTLNAPVLNSPTIQGVDPFVSTYLRLGLSITTYAASYGAFLHSAFQTTYNLAGAGGTPYPLSWTVIATVSSAISAYVVAATAAGVHGVLMGSVMINDTGVANGFNWGPTANGALGRWFADETSYTADTRTGQGLGSWASFLCSPSVGVANAGTFTDGSILGFRFAPTIGAGVTLNAASSVVGLSMSLTAVAGVLSLTRFLLCNAPTLSGGGSIATYLAVDIAAATIATTNMGIRTALPIVETPTIKTITAVGDTIPITAPTVELNNTSGSSKTLTSAPTLADGQDGQRITIFNGSAQNVVLQDQGTLASSNLRLAAATRTLATRDSIRLMYSSTVGDWIEQGFSDVV